MNEGNFRKLVFGSMAFGIAIWLVAVTALITVGIHFIVRYW